MKTVLISGLILLSFANSAFAQKVGKVVVPAAVRTALLKKYPSATKVTWEKENGNYEANWGGKSGEDNSVQYTPNGEFIEIVNAIPVSQLPAPIVTYIKAHYKGSKITEAGRVTDAKGKISYEAEVNKKDIIFDEKGNFLKVEN